jgi:hypothetical protein
MKRAYLILVDGLRPDVLESEHAAGRLPHLARITERGARSRAVSVFPTTTSVAYLPFLTGCFPGTCNIPSIRWLDRETYRGRWWKDRAAVRSYCGYQAGMLDDDIAPHVETIFQLVPESLGIFTMITRGLPPERDPAQGARKVVGSIAHYTGGYEPLDRRAARELLASVDSPMRFVFAQFPGIDGYTHSGSPDSPDVLRSLQLVDQSIGAVTARLQEKGELDDTLFVLVSDHGATKMHTHLDLALWFSGKGIPTLHHPVLWTRNPRAAVMVAGNAFASVYARPGVVRANRLTMDQLRRPEAFGTDQDMVTALVREPAVGFVAAQDADANIRVASAAGEAVITRNGDTIHYTLLSGDPLEMGASFAGDREEWLAHTFDMQYPDAAVHLLDQFSSPRGGDLVISAREGYDFRSRYEIPEHRSGHGSLIRAHMHTPLWTSHPLPAARLRTADVFPALLDWLDVPVPQGIDGRGIWQPGSAARGKSPRRALAGSSQER